MSAAQALTGSAAANRVIKWLRAWYCDDPVPDAIDLEVVRQILPSTPFGSGVREILRPVPLEDDAFEGMLARAPNDHAVWGIAYNGSARPERQRFTIAHELGHFVLHRKLQETFNCDLQSVHTGIDTLRDIEREADDFASNLLMPGDVLRNWIDRQRVDFHLLSDIATRFQVSLEAACIRFIKYTNQRAILLHWDNGFLKYEWRSRSAVRTRARIRRTSNPQEPLPDTLAADQSVAQAWDGIELPASTWCAEEASYMKLRELKHSFGAHDRILTLLLLEAAEPRPWDRSWQDEEVTDSFDHFVSNGQSPVR